MVSFQKKIFISFSMNIRQVNVPRVVIIGGFFARFLWMFVDLTALVGFRNRVVVFFNWTYNYINFDKATQLITRRFNKLK